MKRIGFLECLLQKSPCVAADRQGEFLCLRLLILWHLRRLSPSIFLLSRRTGISEGGEGTNLKRDLNAVLNTVIPRWHFKKKSLTV